MNKLYKNIIYHSQNRIINLLDKNSASVTYGCFDRNYWQYKTVTDFPSSIYQQGVLSLALYYLNDFENNFLYQNKTTLEFIFAGLNFWQKIQNKNGSFNEWYAGENSQVATAFTSYAVSETLLLLNKEISHSLKSSLIKSLEKSNNFLIKNNDYLVANHEAGTLISLLNFYLLTNDEKVKQLFEKKLNYFLSLQNKEGWFAEYGGADGGYLSLTLEFLAKIYLKTKDEKILHSLKKGYNFLLNLFYPDNTFNLELGSRNTAYLFPAGLEISANLNLEPAIFLKQKFYEVLSNNTMPNPLTVDDRYLVFFFLPDYLQAGAIAGETKQSQCNKDNYELRITNYELKEERLTMNNEQNDEIVLPSVTGISGQADINKVFNLSGLIISKNNFYSFYANYKKGLNFKLFFKNKLLHSDVGYFLKTAENYYATCWLDTAKKLKQNSKDEIEIISPFVIYKNFTTEKKLLFFKLFFKYLGKTNFAFSLQKLIRKYFIMRFKKSKNYIKRKIKLAPNKVIITDELFLTDKHIEKLSLSSAGTIIYSPTSNNLTTFAQLKVNEFDNLKIHIKNSKLSIIRNFSFSNDKVTLQLNINDKLITKEILY